MADKRIKIVLAINNMIIGGAQKLIVDQLRYFDRDKFDYSLVVLSKFPGQKDFFDQLPKDLAIYQFDFKNFRSFSQWFKLFKNLKKIKPDLVRSSLFMTNTIVRILKPFLGYKVIITENNTHHNKGLLKIWTDKILAQWTYKIVADSKTVEEFTVKQEKINPAKFMTIYNGVDIEEINEFIQKPDKDDFKKQLGLDKNDKVVLNIARLVKQKNHKLLIDAFAQFYKNNPDYKLVIVGDGLLMDDLKKQARDLDLADKVILPGASKDLYKYYSLSDLFVISSTQEGFCLTAVMALAFGIPVVSTKVAGLIEYIKDGQNGYLVDFDAQSMASKMSELANISEEDKSKYYKNCRHSAQEFDIKKQALAFEELFLEALNKK